MSHLVPNFFVIKGGGSGCAGRLFTPVMQTLRLQRVGLLKQLAAPTPGCVNRLIHQSAVGERRLNLDFY